MKNSFASKISLLFLAVFVLLTTTATHAVTCSVVQTGNDYPQGSYTQNCTSPVNTTAGSNLFSAVLDSFQNEIESAGLKAYLFNSPSDYVTYANANSMPLGTYASTDFGTVGLAATTSKSPLPKTPIYIAVFMQNQSGTANPNVSNTAGRELGVALDYLTGYVTNGGVVPPTSFQASTSSDFTQSVTNDQTAIKSLTQCGGEGLFYQKQDEKGVYICNGTGGIGTALSSTYSKYAGNNITLLAAAYPSTFGNNQSLFAEEYTANWISRNESANSPDFLLTTSDHFECSSTFNEVVTSDSVMPIGPAASGNFKLPAGCSAPKVTTACHKIFGSPLTGWPSGNVLDCADTATTVDQNASAIEGALQKLGDAPNGYSYTEIKQKFNSIPAYLFVFQNSTAASNAFTAAGQQQPSLTNVVAGTYPNYNLWYTILFTTYFQQPIISTSAMPYTATHEIGHSFDDTRATQVSSLATFDNAMQNDWATLDYVSYPSSPRNPCATIGVNGATYNGPLQGGQVIDPETDKTYCTNGSFTSGSPWAGTNPATGKAWLTSDILRSTKEYGGTGQPVVYQAASTSAIGYNPGYTPKAGWREWHAEAFAIRALADTAATPVVPIFSQIVANGYFQCTAGPNGWVQTEYSTGAIPTSPTCQTLPTGWSPIH